MKSKIAEKNLYVVEDCRLCLHQNKENTWPSSVKFWLLSPGGEALQGVCALTTELDLFASSYLSRMASQAVVSRTSRTSPVFLNTALVAVLCTADRSWRISINPDNT